MDRFSPKYTFLPIGVVSLLFAGAFLVFAQAPDEIIYPIADLGNCESRSECRLYCEEPENIEACTAFAEGHGLIQPERAREARKLSVLSSEGGPGGCSSPGECRTYCNDISNIDECVAFAERIGMDASHYEKAVRIRDALKGGESTPGSCTTREECAEYCREFRNLGQCVSFAERSGLSDEDQLERAERTLELLESGETPGACTSKRECREYCKDPTHIEECVAFGEEIGALSERQAEILRRTRGAGPGGCSGNEACERYCNIPENRETCFGFALENGLVEDGVIDDYTEKMGRLRLIIDEAPARVRNCLAERVGERNFDRILSNSYIPGPRVIERMLVCFEGYNPNSDQTDRERMDRRRSDTATTSRRGQEDNDQFDSCLRERLTREEYENRDRVFSQRVRMVVAQCRTQLQPGQDTTDIRSEQDLRGGTTHPIMDERRQRIESETSSYTPSENFLANFMTSYINLFRGLR